jgi:hypothetical protein
MGYTRLIELIEGALTSTRNVMGCASLVSAMPSALRVSIFLRMDQPDRVANSLSTA